MGEEFRNLQMNMHYCTYLREDKKASITCGVPQGSNLRSLIFLLCVNDITHLTIQNNSICTWYSTFFFSTISQRS